MRFFQDTSIQRKQMLIIMLTCTVALLLACAIFVVDDVFNFRKGIVKKVSVLAEAIGNNTSATIEYNDPKTAEDTLRALRAEPSIVAACVYTRTGELFASFKRDGTATFPFPPQSPNGHRFEGNSLYLFHPIRQQGESIGTIFVASDLTDLKQRLGRYPAIVGGMFAAALLVAFVMSTRLQRVVSGPILHLARVTRSVAEDKNYSVRAEKQSGDELGQLIDGFNEMLAQIQMRDVALRAAHETLENRVQERTEELRQSQALYHSLVQHLPMLVYRKDEAGRFVYVNALFCEFHGTTADQILGRTTFDVRDSSDLTGHWAQEDLKMIETGQPVELEMECRDLAGNVRYLQIFKSPVFGPDGKAIGIQGTLLDVTERRQTAAKLEEAHRELVTASRQAGMAEVATSVLHNVGNVLNSVNISATVIFDTLKKSKAGNVGRVVSLLQTHSANLGEFLTHDPQGKQIPSYLSALSEHLAGEQNSILKEAEALKQHIDHIKSIVAMQQNYAKVAGVTEIVGVTELVEDALRLDSESLGRHNVQIVRDFGPQLPDINVDKHKALQILVNMIQNAKRACKESGREEKTLIVTVRNGNDHLKISISDNGIGIPPENLTKIFNHGFTTRKGGHGFGLHSGALAAKEMGGTLLAYSEGPDKGATFTLTLPLVSRGHGQKAKHLHETPLVEGS
ncbi:MAG: PAS domain S-box protein [Akkermansiaceae bacterium]|nr:PAS domain S-box protein [Verrucomicrobiales bacterium]